MKRFGAKFMLFAVSLLAFILAPSIAFADVSLPDHDWSIYIFGHSWGLRGWGIDTHVFLGPVVFRVPLRFEGTVSLVGVVVIVGVVASVWGIVRKRGSRTRPST